MVSLLSQDLEAFKNIADKAEDIDSNKLFHLLPQEHRDAFLAAIRDPDSEAGRQLLETLNENGQEGDEELITPNTLPWWEAPDVADDEVGSDPDELEYAEPPSTLSEELFSGIAPPEGMGSKLVYNALTLW